MDLNFSLYLLLLRCACVRRLRGDWAELREDWGREWQIKGEDAAAGYDISLEATRGELKTARFSISGAPSVPTTIVDGKSSEAI
ncbi:UNVERIFIED_CONTAM: hypothetical protein Sangu_1002600 [Sesamum angustifolium]|uniref:Uncharacterized protein n=1 Tax=Sesamum angustifolium TaxID=2727405 RepID=A0AAW2PG54_9LAMI